MFISSSFIPSYAANSINVMKMAEAIANESCQVKLIARSSSVKNNDFDCVINDIYNYYDVKDNFTIHLSKIKQLRLFIAMVVGYAFIKRPAILYTRNPFIALLSSRIGIKTIWHCHGLLKGNTIKYVNYLPRSKYLKKVAVVSEGLKQVFKSEYGIDSPKIKVIPNGVDIKRFEPVLSKQTARKITSLPLGKKIVCYSGHLYDGRGIDLILKMSEMLTECLFVIVGGLPGDVKRWSERAGNNVKFLGHVLNSEVPSYLFSADVLLMPYQDKLVTDSGSVQFGSIIRPLKLYEYMASQRPIVASDLPGLREVLSSENSMLVEASSVSCWVEAIKTILNDPQLEEVIASQARKDVMNYTNQKIAQDVLR